MINLGKSRDDKLVSIDDTKATNKHTLIVGESGVGKTVLSQYLLAQVIKNGGTVIALDSHGSLANDQIFDPYVPFFEENVYNIEVHDDGVRCPLFSPLKNADGTIENTIDTVGAITNNIADAFGAGVRQKVSLRKAVEYVLEMGLYKTQGISALEQALYDTRKKGALEMAEKLYFVSKHNIFRHGEKFIEDNKINIFRLSKFDLNTQIQISELLLSYIWRLANVDTFKSKNICLFIDEAQNMPSGKKSNLATLLSEGRRFGVNLLLATQMILQSSTDVVQQRISQCGTMVFFRPASDRMTQTARIIDASKADEYVRLLRHLGVGEFIADGHFVMDGIQYEGALQMSTIDCI